jgi:hypothetical protein
LGLISIYCAVKLRKQTPIRFITFLALSVFLVYGVSFFSELRWISVDRGVLMASIALAALPVILFTFNKNGGTRRWRKQLLVMAILVLVVPNYVLVHELPTATWVRVGTINVLSSFVADHRSGRPIASLDDFSIYYCYYEPSFTGYQTLDFEKLQSLDEVRNFLTTRPAATLEVVHYRATVDWSLGSGQEEVKQWDSQVYVGVNQRLDKIYSNGFDVIYE